MRRFRRTGVDNDGFMGITIDDLIQPSLEMGWRLGATREQQRESIEAIIDDLIRIGLIEEVFVAN